MSTGNKLWSLAPDKIKNSAEQEKHYASDDQTVQKVMLMGR
ncbi:hypothetical protein PGR6_35370 [Pseudomonas sp. GR 6-02]|nr:hypothetical protein PGR6_35370 [Pseudomonas sp. GR 6-02]